MKIRDLINIVEAAQRHQDHHWPYEHLYHVTPLSNLESIRQHGLQPSNAKVSTQAVYLASDEDHALGYIDHHGVGDNGAVLLAIRWSDLDPSLFGADDHDFPDMLDEPDEWIQYSWVDSLNMSGQCLYQGIIPPSVIEVIGEYGD